MTSDFDKVLADTHALIWYLTGSSRLSATADQILQRAERGEIGLIVPTIVLAEAISVSERKNPGISIDEILERLARMPSALVVSLDLPVLNEVLKLPATLEMHDRIIVATARVYSATLLSRDRAIGDAAQTVW